MTSELAFVLTKCEGQLLFDLRQRWSMTLEEFFELDAHIAIVAVHYLLNDTGSLVGAYFARWDYPLPYLGMWQLMSAAAVVNMGKGEKEEPLEPTWPLPASHTNVETHEEATAAELEQAVAFLQAHSAIPKKKRQENHTQE